MNIIQNPVRSERTNPENQSIIEHNRNNLSRSDLSFANSMLDQLYEKSGLSEKQWYWMDVLAGRCITIAKDYGSRTGRCMFCRRKLSDDRSLAVGYGPDCAKSHFLPWG